MSLYITSLNSGSNGNCYYIGNEHEAVLIDAGISCREIEKRMKRLGLCMQKIKGIFVSHEHTDHIKGLPSLAKKYQFPIYITPATLFHSRCTLDKHIVTPFFTSEPIVIGNLTIEAFSKLHDACDPCSFTVSCHGIKVGIFTDIGKACKNLIHHFKNCHAAFLEANYDEEMLNNGSYPYYLKNRIRGGRGHLSNNDALQLFTAYRPAFMSHLVLSHLSRNNNCPNLVKRLFDEYANGVKVVVASRFEETALYHVSDNSYHKKVSKTLSPSQLSFSFY